MEAVYKEYIGTKTEMDGRTFAKLCKEKGLFDKGYTPTDCDLIFAKVKERGKKSLSVKEFEAAIQQIADKKKSDVEAIKEKIGSGGGPAYTGTKADEVRLHDDKSTYTGAHAHGGPSSKDAGVTHFTDLSQVCDRKEANVRGMPKSMEKSRAEYGAKN
eukprot:GHVU01075542.1.p1 GENE.GHVU01075542.1~~GHVU01075542.1.p1  ORF type:complete len:158 (+),score=31.34 GHVU01075542.1:12-485(+)